MSQVISKNGFIANEWAETAIPGLSDYSGGSAILLAVDENAEDLLPHFEALRLIVIPFQSSADGRGFSHARTLRLLGFEGHIRAKGHILVDQFRAALFSGFTDIEIDDAQAQRNPEKQWQSVSLDIGYQPRVFTS